MTLPKHNRAILFFAACADAFASVRMTVILLSLLAAAAVIGTIIPQNLPDAEYRRLLGPAVFPFFSALGLTGVYRSFLFCLPLTLVAVNTLVCTMRASRSQNRPLSFYVVHAGLLILMLGSLTSALTRVRGEIRLRPLQSADTFWAGGRQRPLGFSVRLREFRLLKHERQGERLVLTERPAGKSREFFFEPKTWTAVGDTGYRFRVDRYLPDFRADAQTGTYYSASARPLNPAVYVVLEDPVTRKQTGEWVFHRFADFHAAGRTPFKIRYEWAPTVPRAYISRIEISENGRTVREDTVSVNRPVRHRGCTLYQFNYDPFDFEWSGIEVVRDRGAPMVFASFAVLFAGLMMNLARRVFAGDGRSA